MVAKIDVKGKEITIISNEQLDYILLTDIAKYKNNDAPADIVKNWLRSRSTVEYLGLWEQLNNTEFKNEAGSNYFRKSEMNPL